MHLALFDLDHTLLPIDSDDEGSRFPVHVGEGRIHRTDEGLHASEIERVRPVRRLFEGAAR